MAEDCVIHAEVCVTLTHGPLADAEPLYPNTIFWASPTKSFIRFVYVIFNSTNGSVKITIITELKTLLS